MSRKKAAIETVEQALAFLDYQSAFAKGDTAANCSEIASVIRDLIGEGDSQYDAEWVYVGSPRDVVEALMQRAWDDGVSDDDRTLLELGAKALETSLDRNVKLASVIEKSELGL
jgi:alkanesulfonate monooxygenase SsuD/methylene tetrahydromethanopterin reductase-like flavin-dependent oxidoreductase (luciferase family)